MGRKSRLPKSQRAREIGDPQRTTDFETSGNPLAAAALRANREEQRLFPPHSLDWMVQTISEGIRTLRDSVTTAPRCHSGAALLSSLALTRSSSLRTEILRALEARGDIFPHSAEYPFDDPRPHLTFPEGMYWLDPPDVVVEKTQAYHARRLQFRIVTDYRTNLKTRALDLFDIAPHRFEGGEPAWGMAMLDLYGEYHQVKEMDFEEVFVRLGEAGLLGTDDDGNPFLK